MQKSAEARRQGGFSLVELLVAMVVTTIAIVGVATLLVSGIRLQTLSREATMANALAKAKIEELRTIAPEDPRRSVGGSLDADVADHFDLPSPRLVRRWQVMAGPDGTQDVAIVVLSRLSEPLPRIQIRVLLP